MPADNSLDTKIIEKLNSLPRVTLSAEAKQDQLGSITSAIATGAVVMISVPLYRLLLSRIKETIGKYLIFSTFVSLAVVAVLTYLVYPQTAKPPSRENPAIIQQPKKKAKVEKPEPTTQPENSPQVFQEPEPSAVLGQEEEQVQATAGLLPAPSLLAVPAPQEPPSIAPPAPPPQKPPSCILHVISRPPFLVGTSVKFAAECSDSDGHIEKVVWTFGDGSSLEIRPDIELVDHVYTAAGVYSVSLTVFDDDGNSAADTEVITVIARNKPPVAQFSHDASNKTCRSVEFNNESYDPDGFIVQTLWDFGDGSTGSEENPTHVYQESGTYEVRLTVIDNQGAASSVSEEIEIGGHRHRKCRPHRHHF